MSPERKVSPAVGADHDRILEAVGVAVLTIDAAGTLLEANAAAVAMFGYAHAALIGANVTLLMPASHADAHDGYIRHHLETGERRIIGRGRKVFGRKANGSLFPMHLAVGRIDVDGEAYFTGIVHDLSDAERDHETATRLGHIVEASLNEIYVFAADTLRFTIVNRSAAANLGYSVAELETMTPVDIKPLYDKSMFARLIEPLRAGEIERLRFQTVHQRKDGSRYDVEIMLHLSDAVSAAEYVAVVQDVTERNRLLAAFQQAQKMDAIGQLTGGIAHDFNNLLTVIGGNLELLEMNLGADDAPELVEEAREAARMGAALTARLLSFARRSSLSPESLDVNELVLGLADLLRRSLGESVSLKLVLAPGLWPVTIDASLTENALMNLAINARDAMEARGELLIETGMRSLDAASASLFDLPAGDYVTLGVADDGAGIARDDLPRVFDPFFTTKSTTGGHGLGLSMVYGFARQSGGHVAVDSAPGEGARFTLLLPRGEPADTEVAAQTPTVRVIPQHRRLILVVEDDERVRRLTVRRVRYLGHDTLEAADGPSAIAAFEARPEIDLLFSDMLMPNGMSGLELARALRARRPGLPVLIASGYADGLVDTRTLDEERVALLKKPYENGALADTLRELLSASSVAEDRGSSKGA